MSSCFNNIQCINKENCNDIDDKAKSRKQIKI